jgi:hypothetical protein
MSRSADETRAMVSASLRTMSWPTARELATRVHLSTGTVRQYLTELICAGDAERRQDEGVNSPRGAGASRYNALLPSIGPPPPTDQLLCEGCIQKVFRDSIRYHAALSPDVVDKDDPWERWRPGDPEPTEAEEKAYHDNARCDRCGGRRFNSV